MTLVFLDALALGLELLYLILGVCNLICAIAPERLRIVRVLRHLLVEDVLFSVAPVREALLVVTCFLNGRRVFEFLASALLGTLALGAIVDNFGCGCKVHRVRIDYLGFLLQIECLLVALHIGLIKLVSSVVLFVTRKKILGVGVAHKAV